MNKKVFSQGAEAIISLENNMVVKNRISKTYRNKQLDERIRKSRTKREAKLLEKANKITQCPRVIKQEQFSITMEYIEGDKLSEKLNQYSIEKQKKIMLNLGKEIGKLHENDIIHGDLTTSNVILKQTTIFIIDFGLGFISKRIEDRAVDIHLIKQALEARHWQNHQKLFENFLIGYKTYKDSEKVIIQLRKVESRGRYKKH